MKMGHPIEHSHRQSTMFPLLITPFTPKPSFVLIPVPLLIPFLSQFKQRLFLIPYQIPKVMLHQKHDLRYFLFLHDFPALLIQQLFLCYFKFHFIPRLIFSSILFTVFVVKFTIASGVPDLWLDCSIVVSVFGSSTIRFHRLRLR